MKRGKFITFEGVEGSGKSTQARRLAERLEAAGRGVLLTREPGGTGIGEVIRRMLKKETVGGEALCAEAEVLLFAASRAQLVRSVIIPALERGTTVISDRFADSTTVYQGIARGLPMEAVLAINRFVMGPAMPDLTILLDLDAAAGMERLRRRCRAGGGKNDRIENEGAGFHGKVRKGYLSLARSDSRRVKIVDASLDRDSVAETVWRIVSDAVR